MQKDLIHRIYIVVMKMKAKYSNIKTDLKCNLCKKEFKYESEKKRHEQSHSPQFECKVCSKKFSFMSALKRHEKQHERTGNVTCQECNGKFRDESLLNRHIKYAHKGEYTCKQCKVIFSSELALRSHQKTHKPASERRFRCSFDGCPKSFNFAHHLKHHELTHTNTKQHFCNVCGKGFIQYHHLKSHLKRHNQDLNSNESYSNVLTSNIGSNTPDSTENNDARNIFKPQKKDSIETKTLTVCDSILNLSQNAFNKHNTDAQINILPEVTKTPIANLTNSSIQEIGKPEKLNNSCEMCSCGNSKMNAPIIKTHDIDTSSKTDDVVELKLDGTIKIKNTFDMDIDFVNVNNNIAKDTTVHNVPFNSCKDILGTCIVSGNGTIGEGCLCAKMAMDDQINIDQEIDEITPRPKVW